MDDRTREGEAYAVLTDEKELVFFRSEENYENGEITRARDVLGNEYEGVVYSEIETKRWNWDNVPGWHGKHIRSARIADGQTIAPVSCALWFYWQDAMVACNLGGLDTSKVTDMNHMFCCCTSLQTPPDTSKWDTSSLREYEHMFLGCTSLANVPEVQTVVRIKSERDNVALDAGILADTQYLRDVLNNDPSRIDPAGNLNEVEFEEEVERLAKEAAKGNEFRDRLRRAITEDSHLWGRLQDIVDQELYHFVDERVRTPSEPTR